jgi:hypothetical protein
MEFNAYECENLFMRRIQVAGGGMTNGNAYADVEIHYLDSDMTEIDIVWYKEYGKNPIAKRIGNEIEWGEEGDFKVLEKK